MAEAPKAPVAIRITRPYADEDEYLARESEAITRTGVLLLGAQPRPEGVILRFEVVLRSGVVLLRGEGRVVGYRAKLVGEVGALALRFTRLDTKSKALVDRAVALREARGDTKLDGPGRPVARPEPPGTAKRPSSRPPPPPSSRSKAAAAPVTSRTQPTAPRTPVPTPPPASVAPPTPPPPSAAPAAAPPGAPMAGRRASSSTHKAMVPPRTASTPALRAALSNALAPPPEPAPALGERPVTNASLPPGVWPHDSSPPAGWTESIPPRRADSVRPSTRPQPSSPSGPESEPPPSSKDPTRPVAIPLNLIEDSFQQEPRKPSPLPPPSAVPSSFGVRAPSGTPSSRKKSVPPPTLPGLDLETTYVESADKEVAIEASHAAAVEDERVKGRGKGKRAKSPRTPLPPPPQRDALLDRLRERAQALPAAAVEALLQRRPPGSE